MLVLLKNNGSNESLVLIRFKLLYYLGCMLIIFELKWLEASRSETEETQNAHGHHISQTTPTVEVWRGCRPHTDFPGNADVISHTDVCRHQQTQLMEHRLESQTHRHSAPHTLWFWLPSHLFLAIFSHCHSDTADENKSCYTTYHGQWAWCSRCWIPPH